MAEEKRSANRIRSRQFIVRLLEEEYLLLEAKADEAQLSKSEFIRNMILYGSARPKTNFTREEARELVTAINRVGNNINQLTLVANSTKNVDRETLNSVCELMNELEQIILDRAWE